MKKLIYLEDALNIAMQYCPDDDGSCGKSGVDIREMLDELESLPPAQPEIIRCKDCLYWIPGYITDQDDFIPPKCGKYQQMVGHSADDFCSLAERREE